MSSLSTDDIELNPTGVHHNDDTQIQQQSVRFSKQLTKFKLSDEERAEYENIYHLFTGAEKNISANEVGSVMKKLGIHCSEEELDDMIGVVDKDGYGLINKKRFMNLMTQKVKETSEDKNAEIFETAFSL
jgi:Ca2+-binding EF-hand superfamily protein